MYSVASGPSVQDDAGSGGNCTVTEAPKFPVVEVNETRSGITPPPGCRYSALTVYAPIGMFPIELLTQSPAIALKELPALPSISGPLGTKLTRTWFRYRLMSNTVLKLAPKYEPAE